MKEYREKSSFRHLDIIGDVYIGLLLGLLSLLGMAIVFSKNDANNLVNPPNWVETFILFYMMFLAFLGGCGVRKYYQWSRTIWIDIDKQIVEVEFYYGSFLRYKYRKIPFSNLNVKLNRVRVGAKPSNRMIYEIRIFDKEEPVTTCGLSDKWTNGGFDELVAEFSSIKEEYCEKKTDLLSD